jgi:GntR family transcriptional repressor for pyruvate dehydrogenase complex
LGNVLNLQQIKTMKIYEKVAEQLKEAILAGTFQPGDRLPSVRELGEKLQVGQPAVREAFTALKAIGLIDIRQGEGTFVAKYNSEDLKARIEEYQMLVKQDVEKLYEVRRLLEVGSAEFAAQRRTSKEVERMKEALYHLERSTITGDAEQHDWAFHFAIALAAQNPILVNLMESISQSTKKILSNAREELFEHRFETICEQHRDILNAIENQDSKMARKAMLKHLNYVEQKLF